MKYRAEIDGLRAIAVIPVIFFHAGFDSFSGGFVGVDVFFVISGYLITTILIEDIERQRFSIVNFYERRARRILPALFFVMAASLPFAWLWMIPSQLKDFSQSVVAVSLFASNILFWLESGYFSPAAEEMPLLHTWSLAVEEQYYLLFPVFLFAVWRLGKKRVFWLILMLAGVSLLSSEWISPKDPMANFYLAPTRAWELFAGSLAAFIVRQRGVQASGFLSAVGLTAILFSIVSYDRSTPFPGVYALLPVAGVVLVVLFADQTTMVARMLSVRPLVGVGLISYSAYLWHQPLFAFARLRSFEPPGSGLLVLLATASLGLAVLSWKFVEQPFRNRQRISRKVIFAGSGVVAAPFLLFGLIGQLTQGFRYKYPDIITQIDSAGLSVKAQCLTGKFNHCILGDATREPTIALLGDSHAGRYAYALDDALATRHMAFELYAGRWCAPLLEWKATRNGVNEECAEGMTNAIEDILNDDSIELVILSAEWANYTRGYRFESQVTTFSYAENENYSQENNPMQFEQAFLSTSDTLSGGGKQILVIEPVPEYEYRVPNALAKRFLLKGEAVTEPLELANYFERNREFFEVLGKADSHGVQVIRVYDDFCDDTECVPYTANGLPLYHDGNHLSELGLTYILDEIVDKIVELSR